jgi:superfamily II DNA or RNA helicase
MRKSGLYYKDEVQDLVPCPQLRSKTKLRSYQQQAIEAWKRAQLRGVVVLPTGAGKTVVGFKAIEIINGPTLVVAPTLDLLYQWKRRLADEFDTEVGTVGGGDLDVRALTVSTYDSAYLRASELGNKFSLLIFDEVHHLAAPGYRQIAEMFTAMYRLGLTATFEREDMQHEELLKLVGGVVFRLGPNDLAGNYLSDYVIQRVNVQLTDQEKIEYDRNYKMFKDYVMTRRIRLATPLDFQRFVMRSSFDPEARKALLARNRAIGIAFNSQSKIDALEEILKSNPEERTIIFTQHNELVYRISRRFLIPFITHTSNPAERREVLEGFRDGRFRAVVTSKVLDEGIDVPEASLGIIVSGTGSSREFIQRLGRLLRKREGKGEAKLIEIISQNTSESRTSYRRKRAAREAKTHEAKGRSESESEPERRKLTASSDEFTYGSPAGGR